MWSDTNSVTTGVTRKLIIVLQKIEHTLKRKLPESKGRGTIGNPFIFPSRLDEQARRQWAFREDNPLNYLREKKLAQGGYANIKINPICVLSTDEAKEYDQLLRQTFKV